MTSVAARITAVVLMQDVAPHVRPCLRTLRWADQMLVVDGGSVDDTVALAEAAGARVLSRRWDHYTAQRTFALSQVQTPWVLFVDADERVPLELAREVRAAIERTTRGSATVGFWLPRQNLILGKWVRHAGWYPDYQLRLFRVGHGRYDPHRQVHELVHLDGPSERLRATLLHHNYVTWSQFWTKQLRYARAEASEMHVRGLRTRPHNLLLQPLRELRRRYLSLGGYRAGTLGLQLSLVLAFADGVKYAELHRLARAGR